MIELIGAMFLKDGYKVDHRPQYVEGTEDIYGNFCPRSSRDGKVNSITWVGAQYLLMEYIVERWNKTFFERPEEVAVLEYKRIIDAYVGQGKVTYEHVRELHRKRYLPIEIKALKEGSLVPMGVPVLTVHCTDPDFFWLSQMLETLISCVLWQPSTSATTSYQFRKRFEKHAIRTGYDRDFVKWQGHDFSFRGMPGVESAIVSGFAHICVFFGTDTLPSLLFAELFYGANVEKEIVGMTVPATEHSVMSLGIKQKNEFELLKRLITQVYPSGILSAVLDTNDFWTALDIHVRALKKEIMEREGRFVSRPDSGDPVRIICGYREDEILRVDGKIYVRRKTSSDPVKELTEVEVKGAWQCLWDIFGGTISKKGYKLLDTHVGLIYGDAINMARQDEILTRLEEKGFAFNNGVLGMGSYSFQFVTRDTYRWAIKATSAVVNGERWELSKDPKTDSGFKKSACGLLAVFKRDDGTLYVKDHCTVEEEKTGLLETVFIDGKITRFTTLAEIRALVEENLERELHLELGDEYPMVA